MNQPSPTEVLLFWSILANFFLFVGCVIFVQLWRSSLREYNRLGEEYKLIYKQWYASTLRKP